jgi:hypothetical protein
MPVIAVTQLPDPSELDEALLKLDSFTHVAFTSRNGIQAVLQRLEALHGGTGDRHRLTPCVRRVLRSGLEVSAMCTHVAALRC